MMTNTRQPRQGGMRWGNLAPSFQVTTPGRSRKLAPLRFGTAAHRSQSSACALWVSCLRVFHFGILEIFLAKLRIGTAATHSQTTVDCCRGRSHDVLLGCRSACLMQLQGCITDRCILML